MLCSVGSPGSSMRSTPGISWCAIWRWERLWARGGKDLRGEDACVGTAALGCPTGRSPVLQLLCKMNLESSFQLQAARKIRQAGDVVLRAPFLQFIHNLLGGARIEIAGCADLDGSCARQNKFHDIRCG